MEREHLEQMQKLYKSRQDSEHLSVDVQLESTMSDVRLSVDTAFWRDVQKILQKKVVDERDGLELMGQGYSLNDIAFTQGKICAFREVLDIADLFANIIEALKAEKEDENGR